MSKLVSDELTWHHSLRAPAPPRLQDMNLQPRQAIQRPYGEPQNTLPPDVMPTKVSYQLAPDGPVGSLGLVHMAGGSVDRSLMPNAVSNQPGLPSNTAGASLSFAFH
ncbi:MAG TPA: hypothetical protein VG248_07970 [Caulobacteraceae bacterium]|nr:hypothetical protein [Caulobacteraceae bacterium]